MSLAFSATLTATLRAIVLVDRRRPGRPGRRPRSACRNRPARGSRCRAASAPRKSTPYSAHMRSPPPSPKMCSAWPQLRADVRAHVLDDAEDRHADLLEHLEALARVEQRDVLRRRDDHRAGDRHALRQRQLDVAGAGRHVDDQVVEVAPVGLLAAAARSACVTIGPRQTIGVVRVDQEADRHHLHAVVLQRLHASCRRSIPAGRRCPASSAADGP